MELERNYDEFFAIRAQKFVTKASRSVRTASNNLAQIDVMAEFGCYKAKENLINSLTSNLNRIYRQIMEAEAELIELRRALL